MEYKYFNNSISFEIDGNIYNCCSHFPQSDLNENDYDLLFLSSPYFTAESDYYEVNLHRGKRKSRLGWVIPINLLCNTDNDYLSKLDIFLLKYADVAYRKLLTFCIENRYLSDLDFEITNILPDSIIIFIYNKSNLSKSEISYVIPSLYDKGFYSFDDPLSINVENMYCSQLMSRKIREEKSNGSFCKINIRLMHEKYHHILFFKNLYSYILPNNSNPFFRYISLYQVIEILMSFAFDDIYFTAISDYNLGQYTKNELREKLQESSKEKELINRIYININQTSPYYNDFIDSVKSLFTSIDKDSSRLNNYQDYMYTLRNLIIHEMRNLLEHSEQMVEIVDCYEKLIFILLDECKLDKNDKKGLFVIDKEYSAKTNRKKMKQTYNNI